LIDAAIERRVDQSGKRAQFERLHEIARRVPKPIRRLFFRPVLGQFGGRLHTIGVGASALDLDIARRWTDMGVDVLQGYGATEMGPVVSFTRPERNVLGTVGEPIPGVEVRIADDVEAILKEDDRVKDAAIVAWPLGAGLKVHAVLLLEDPARRTTSSGRP